MKKNEYKKRIADKILEDKLATFGGVLILGPKGCGKTTTALMKAKTIIESIARELHRYFRDIEIKE